jgi:hypothetical protein
MGNNVLGEKVSSRVSGFWVFALHAGHESSTVVCQKSEVSHFRFSNWLQCAIWNCFVLCVLFSFNVSWILAMAWNSTSSHESCPFLPAYLVSCLQRSITARCWNLQQGHSRVPPTCDWRMSRERLSYWCSVCVSAQLDMDKPLRNKTISCVLIINIAWSNLCSSFNGPCFD